MPGPKTESTASFARDLARLTLAFAALLSIAGCARIAAPTAPVTTAATSTELHLTAPAFGQRIAIDFTGAGLLEARFNRGSGTPWEPLERFLQLPGRLVFELPAPGPFPGSDDFDPYAFGDPPAYEDRGPVEVGFFPAGAPLDAEPRRTVLYEQPYGSVVAGELNVLTPLRPGGARGCARRTLRLVSSVLEFGRAQLPEDLARNVATSERLGLCLVTVEIGANDTDATLAAVEALSPVLAVGRNVVLDLDGGSVNAFDPTCDQIADDGPVAVGSQGFAPLKPAELIESVAADPVDMFHGITGASALVAVVGGGVEPDVLSAPGQIVGGRNLIEPAEEPLDRFGCDGDDDGEFESFGHDTHIAELVNLIAPSASLLVVKICSDQGLCPSGKLAMALLGIAERAPGTTIVNASAGSPLPDPAVDEILARDADSAAPRLLLVTTAGNLPNAPRHSPGSLDAAGQGPLRNVIAVGASGLQEDGVWAEAKFSNSDVASVMAPGARLCPDTAGFACDVGAGEVAEGIGGTSYAAPIVAGTLALYADMKTQANVAFSPEELRGCLENHRLATRPQFVFDENGDCSPPN